MRLGHQVHRVNVVHRLERVAQAEAIEDAQRIGLVAVGEDELAARQLRDRGGERGVGLQHVHLDRMDIGEEVVRIDVMFRHQPGQRRAVAVEIVLLQPARLVPRQLQQPRDIIGHPLVDLREQVRARRIERVVQIEDPGVDMGERRQHRRASRRGGGPAQARAACFGLGRDKPLYDCERSLA